MKNEIEQIIVNHINRKISLGEATTQILRLFAVSGRSEQLNDFADWLERNWFEYSDRDSRCWVKEYLEGKGI